mmetsp:Transcript_16359/g.35535  ORF Transcript_16359/g.35535 Transcript_16359/m.35535 type:complete len:94 (-) Transcript_16359:843-1124(-)
MGPRALVVAGPSGVGKVSPEAMLWLRDRSRCSLSFCSTSITDAGQRSLRFCTSRVECGSNFLTLTLIKSGAVSAFFSCLLRFVYVVDFDDITE